MVYYALDVAANMLKIGCSHDPVSRVRQLRATYPSIRLIATEPGSFGREAELCRLFSPLLLYGREWFAYTDSLRHHVESLVLRRPIPLVDDDVSSRAERHTFGWIEPLKAHLTYCGAIPVCITIIRDIDRWCHNCRKIVAVPWRHEAIR